MMNWSESSGFSIAWKAACAPGNQERSGESQQDWRLDRLALPVPETSPMMKTAVSELKCVGASSCLDGVLRRQSDHAKGAFASIGPGAE